MPLVACARCNRHIRDSATRCPFCDASRETHLITRVIDTGARLSRAAVFAGAAACYTSPPAPQGPPPPPPPDQTATGETTGGGFAQPPPDGGAHGGDTQTAPPIAGGTIDGVARDGGMQQPIPHAMISLIGTGIQQVVNADEHGRFAFHGLPAGRYQIALQGQTRNPRQAPPTRVVTLVENGTEHIILNVPPYVPDRGPCCKPYGAPPARRRVV